MGDRDRSRAGPSARRAGAQAGILLAQFRDLRQATALSQSAVSRMSGVPQPQISKIERGLVNPTVATLTKLVNALRDHQQGGGSAPQSARRHPLPVLPLHQTLPLLDAAISWGRFEEFCRDFVSRLPGVRRVHSYGRQGSKQRGIDFPAEMESGETWAFQCRQVKDFSVRQFHKTVKAADFPADRYVLLVGCQAGAALRDVELATDSWEIWDVTDISRMVRQLSLQDQRSLVTSHFGPHVLVSFVGVNASSAFRRLGEHFEPYLRSGRIFHHRFPLIGRTAVTKMMMDGIEDDSVQVLAVTGRGGIGKTKVLHALGQQHLLRFRDRELLYADEGTPFTSETLPDIPAFATTLVVDDAHRRDDLPTLLSFVARWPAPVKLVLALRPEGHDRVAAILSESGIDPSEVRWLAPLLELPKAQGEELAREALGADLAHVAGRLQSVTWDCPLITVVGGHLLRTKQLPPELLERDVDFRRDVLGKFLDAQLGNFTGVDRPLAASLLQLTSALQPLRPADPVVVDGIAKFVGAPKDRILQTFDRLEASGVLVRRGYQLRVVPDVLADHLLTTASLTSAGATTGYVERIFETFQGVGFDRLLGNVAELDWRVQVTTGVGTTLLAQMWNQFTAEFRDATHSQQATMLKMVGEAALFQPGRVLALIEWAIEHPATEDTAAQPRSIFSLGREDVIHAAAALAATCARGGHVRRAADILWRLGRDDDRPTNQFSSHPVRLLQELAGYDIGKPLYVSSEILESAKEWLAASDAHEHPHSPLDILDALLVKNTISRSSDGVSINLRPITINRDATLELRREVLNILAGLVAAPESRLAIRAVKSLDGVLREPLPFLGLQITPEEKAAWLEEQIEALEVLRRAMAHQSALVQLEVYEAVTWTSSHSYSPQLRELAQAVKASLPQTLDVRLMDAWTRPWGRAGDISSAADIEDAERRRAVRMHQAADDLAANAPSGESLVAFLVGLVEECERAAVKADGAYLVGLTSERHPQLALEAATLIVDNPGHKLEPWLAQLLMGARQPSEEEALELASRAAHGASVIAARCVAFLYAYRLWRAPATAGDAELLTTLLEHDDEGVRSMAITGVSAASGLGSAGQKKLVLAVQVKGSSPISEALAQALQDPLVPSLTISEVEHVITKFREVPHLDGPHVRMLMQRLVTRAPSAVLQMLLQRVDSMDAADGFSGFQAVPHNWAGDPIWQGVPEATRQDLLSAIRDAALVQTWPRHAVLPELYADIADATWTTAAACLEEWIGSMEDAKVTAALNLFTHAPRDFVFERSDVVVRTLNATRQLGEPFERAARVAFAASARSGVRSGRLLQPSSQDSRLIELAQQRAGELTQGSPAWVFYDNLAADTKAMTDHFLKVEEEMIDGPLPRETDTYPPMRH